MENGRHARQGEIPLANVRVVEDLNKGWGGENVNMRPLGVAML